MRKRQTHSQCDSEKLNQLLLGGLSRAEAAAVESHLSECTSCAEQIQLAAVPGTSWDEAQSMLALDEFDGLPSLSSARSLFPVEVDDREYTPTADLLTREIRGWLDPTDDPQMLGRFAGYEIVGIVGHGGMGIVLKGFEASLNRYVAIKILAPRLATNGAARRRFAREAQAAAAVLHDNVVAIHRVDESHGLPFLVMPYVAGISLQKRINDEGPLPIAAVLRIGSQIAAGLAAAHDQGLVHRDIKPANILLEKGVERVTITDFGLARTMDDATVTRTGVIAGTPQYMSPEQTRGESVDQRSDLFSLGSVLYAMCTARAPFGAETSYGMLRCITDEEPEPIRQINPDVPEWLCAIVAKLMSKQPADRFESAHEVAELLEECLAHVQRPIAVPLPASTATEAHGKRSLSISRLGVIAMSVAFGLGLLGMVLWQASGAPDIAGQWTGEDWGTVVLEAKQPGRYQGRYTDPDNARSGTVRLKWSRVERRFNGSWEEGSDRNGKISIRLDGDQIRGAWTTNRKSKLESGIPRLADLLWVKKPESPARTWVREPHVATPVATRTEICTKRDNIKTFTERADFEACLKQPIRTVNFDDINTGHSGPVPFESDRYAASAGIIITGEQGQYVDESFACPDDFIPSSSPNMYAPGPKATARRPLTPRFFEEDRPLTRPGPLGGHRTEITFVAGGSAAAVAGFGAVFIDADFPNLGPCRIRAFDSSGYELVSWSGFSGKSGSKLFRGIVALDDKGKPVPAISRIEIINGNEWPSLDIGEGVTLDDFVFSAPVATESEPHSVATTTRTPDGGRLTVQPGPVAIVASSEKDAFAVRLKQKIHRLDFDDIDTSGSAPVPFDSNRYAASAGVIIKGTQGQYVDDSFGFPDEYRPISPPNMYAPGPPATASDPPPRGGHRTEITFVANGSEAAVAGFGAVFIDADYPGLGPCTIRAFDRLGKELGSWSGFSGPDGCKLFRGIIAVDDKGNSVSAIARVEIISGNEWPTVDVDEGVTLDDFVFSTPVPMVVRISPEQTERKGAVRWNVAAGGNGHSYQVIAVPEGITWAEANRRAVAGGHLATITSKAENDFVFALVDQPAYWNRMDGGPWMMGPWIGGVQAEGAREPDGGWQWVTAEPFVFTNWIPGDPNDDCKASGAVNRICFYAENRWRSPLWCDAAINSTYNVSYVVEFDRFGTRGEGRNESTSDEWKGGELTSGKMEFEIVDGDKSDDTKKSEDTGETEAKRDRFSLHVEKLSKEQVEQLAWGKESHGLRAALLFEPQKNVVAVGDILKQSYVVRNAGETPLELTATPWSSTDLTKLEVVDQDGKAIAVERTSYSGVMPLDTCTLRPGEAVKIPLRDMSIGAGKFNDPRPDILKPTPGQTCRLRGQLSIERVGLADNDDADESKGFWLGTGVVEFRVTDQDNTAHHQKRGHH